jgi:hypothetical protein
MGTLVIRVLGHAATHAAVKRYARNGGRSRTQYGLALFKDPTVPFGSKFLAIATGFALTGILMLLQVPFEIVIGLIIPFFLDEAAMLMANGLELLLLPVLIASLVLPRLAPRPVFATSVPPVLGHVIDMPPPMLG